MDYMAEYDKVRSHLENMLDSGNYGMKDMAHIGGAAFISLYLEKMAKGEAYKVKKAARPFFDYIFKYEMSKNPTYLILAECELKYVELSYDEIEDESEKEMALEVVEMAKKELLKAKGHSHTQTNYIEENIEYKPSKTYFERV